MRPYRWEPEDTSGKFVRVCPACFKALKWLHYPKLMRMDAPTPSNEIDDISWSHEYNSFVVPRYIDVSIPHCPTHHEVDFWLIKDQRPCRPDFDDTHPLIVGVASDHPTFWPKRLNADTGKFEHPEGGRLFRCPMRTAALLHRKLKRSRSCRYAGRWKFDGNKTVVPHVVPSGQSSFSFE